MSLLRVLGASVLAVVAGPILAGVVTGAVGVYTPSASVVGMLVVFVTAMSLSD